MEQGSIDDEVTINTDSRLVTEFFLNPAAIVFLEDVANEYEVDDPLLHNALVYTVIYRELSARGSLENADHPAYQSNFDWFKGAVNFFSGIIKPIVPAIDGDPSLGIGAINREALARIEQDAQRLDMSIYAPLLGFDIPATLGDIPFSKGVHQRTAESARTAHFINLEFNHKHYPTTVIPPSDEKHGAWRMQLAEFSGPDGGSIQQLYEPTLGLIAAEVAIAMHSSDYQKLETDPERIAYIIGFHANRSAPPAKVIYDLSDIEHESRETTRTEIRWVELFEELVDEHRRQIESRTQEKKE